MLSDADIADLRDRLEAAEFTLDPVLDRLGEAGRRGLQRNSTVPARDALGAGPGQGVKGLGAADGVASGTRGSDGTRRGGGTRDSDARRGAGTGGIGGSDGNSDDPQATLARLWILQDAVPDHALRAALGRSVDALADAGLIRRAAAGAHPAAGSAAAPTSSVPVEEGGWVATAVIRPYGAEASPATPAVSGWICHDPLPNLDTRSAPPATDFVLGISPASTTLSQLTIRTPVERALDLGTGCGVQTLHLAAHAGSIVATDLNPRALDLARITTGLSGVTADLRLGSLYAPVADEGFDLIVSNPPFVIAPPNRGPRLTYREGDLPGDELVRRVLVEGARHLRPDGTMQLLCNWAIHRGTPWDERLAGWLAETGCDGFVVQRERLDPYEYAEIWLSDAGLDGTAGYDARYRDWIDYLDSLGIEGIGLGWISLRNAGRGQPDLRLEDWPYTVHQPLGEAFVAQHRAVDLVNRPGLDPREVRWRVHPEVVQETLGQPGAEDPAHLVLRQSYGLGRALEADTALAAFVGACDGDLTAGEIIGAIAVLTEVDVAALDAELIPRIGELVADGYLTD